ncbi:MAG TPA: CBS domain-containing protein [Candidatus Binataceae bacterium]|nr:CBS domain-containing protein [Candidatus Binataceae bacterium]
MLVAELMTPNVHCCGINETLNSAARIMWEHDCGCVPIVDDGGRVAGVVTDRDVCMASYTQGLPLFALPVTIAMSRGAIACAPTDTVATAHELMRTHEIHRLLVADESGRLVGILSLSDMTNGAGPGNTSAIAATISQIRKRRPSTGTHPGAEKKRTGRAPNDARRRTRKASNSPEDNNG